jgi:4-amino-4-deoxy-L-arabinose transferase-like glycosyltransferase
MAAAIFGQDDGVSPDGHSGKGMSHSQVFFVLFAAFAVRVGYVLLFFAPAHLEAEDQLIYLSLAEAVSQGNWSALTPERTPGYPLFLAGVFFIFGKEYFPLLILQALIDGLTCVLIGLLAFKIFRRGFVLAGMLAVFNLNMVVLSSMALTDSLFLFLFTMSLLLSVLYMLERKSAYFLASIVLLGVATMVRSASYYLIPLLLMGLLVIGLLRGGRLRDVVSLAAVGLLVLGMTLLPQHWRNWDSYQATGFVSQGGTHLLGWVVPAVYQYSGKGSYDEGQRLARDRLEAGLQVMGVTALPVNPFEASSFQSQVAQSLFQEFGLASMLKAWIVGAAVNMAVPSAAFAPVVRSMEHPSFYATPGNGALEKIWNYVTDASGAFYLSILLAGALTSIMFFLLFLVGWWLSWGDKRGLPKPVIVFMTLVILYFLAITGPIIGSKYRLPIEPMMTVFVAYAIIRVTDRSKAR